MKTGKQRKQGIQYKKAEPLKKEFRASLPKGNWFSFLLMFILTLIAYSNSFDVPFQFDDDVQIVYRESSHSFDKFSKVSYWANVNNRPVSSFTLTVNYILNDTEVWGYHLVNLLIHLFSGFFLFLWLKLIIPEKSRSPVHRWLPLIITLFFLVHPVQTQSVTYIVQRMTSMSGMFFFLCLYLYTLGRRQYLLGNRLIQPVLFIFLSIVAGILGTWSKQNAAVFPLAFLLTELFFIRNKKGRICWKYIGSLAAMGLIAGTAFLLKVGLPVETTEISRTSYLATQMMVIPRYFQMMMMPVGLSIDHGVKALDGFGNFKSIAGTIFLLGLALLSIYTARRKPLFAFGILFMFVAFIVESSIFPIRDVMFDQRMYIPLAGFSLALWSLVFDWLAVKKTRLLKGIVIIVLLGMTTGTFARNDVWRDRKAIWEQVTRRYPNHVRGWLGLAKMARAGGDRNNKMIIEALKKANELDPDIEEVILDLGLYYMKTNQIKEGLAAYGKLLGSEDEEYRLLANRTFVAFYIEKQAWDSAMYHLDTILAEYPSDENALASKAGIYIRENDFIQAARAARKVLDLYPGNRKGLFYLGKALFYLEDRPGARNVLGELLKIEPNNLEGLVLYGNACINTLQFDEAIRSFERAYEISRDPKMKELVEFAVQLKAGYQEGS